MKTRIRKATHKVRIGKDGFSKRGAILFGALFAIAGTYVIISSFAATPATANLWIDGNGGTCSPSDTPVTYTDAAACSSAQVAYAKAKGGYNVYYRQGTYSASQDLSAVTQIASTNPVTFQAEPGSTVNLDYIDVTNTNYVIFSDFSTNGWKIKNSQNVTLTRVKASCSDCSTAAIIYDGAKHIRINDSEIGPVDPGDGLQFYPKDNSPVPNTGHNDDIVVDGLYIHDLTRNLDPSAHDDCIAIEDGINMTFKRLKFYNCGTQGFYTSAGGVAPGSLADNITVENSWFGPAPLGYNAVNIRSEANNLVFRNNTFTDAVYLEGVSNVHFVGNIFAGYTWAGADCSYLPDSGHGTVEFKYNVSNVSCGGDSTNKADSTIRTKLVNPDPSTSSGYDAHFKATSGSASAVNMPGFTAATGCASTDYDGDARPFGSSCDAGADEYGSSASTGSTFYISPNGTDTHGCTNNSTDACLTINKAYQAASDGGTVIVASGNYGNQTLNSHAVALTTTGVTVQPAPGATISIGSIGWCGADNITIKGPMTLKGVSTYNCADSLASDVTLDGLTFDYQFDNSSTDGGIVWAGGNTKNWLIKNSDIKRAYNVKGVYLSSWTVGNTPYYPTNIILQNNTIHDADLVATNTNQPHTECIFANKVQGLKLSGNHFYNCVSTGDGIVGNTGAESLAPKDYIFEDNIFEQSWNSPTTPGEGVSAHGVSFDGRAEDLTGHNVFRYNLFETGMFTGGGPIGSGVTVEFYGNIGVPPTCNQMTKSDYNVWTINRACGASINGGHDTYSSSALSSSNFAGYPSRPSTIVLPSQLAPGDWHPVTGALQIGKGDTDSNCSAVGQLGAGSSPCYPSADKDGVARTGTPAAGPYFFAASSSGSAPTNTTLPTISGTLRVSSTLTTSQGSWNNAPTNYTYQWQQCTSTATSSCTNIPGAINTTYKLVCSDYKQYIRANIVATNSSGSTTASSVLSTVIQKPSTPTKGDFNDDCFINSQDLSQFISGWRKTPTGQYAPLDITGPTPNTADTYIDGWDLNMLVSNYGYKG